MKTRVSAVILIAACLALVGCIQNVAPTEGKTVKLHVPNLLSG